MLDIFVICQCLHWILKLSTALKQFQKAVHENVHVTKMAPAPRRHTVGGGGVAPVRRDRRRRRQQNVGGGGAHVYHIQRMQRYHTVDW